MSVYVFFFFFVCCVFFYFFFFFNDTATTEIYTLSLHDALPIFQLVGGSADQTKLFQGIVSKWTWAEETPQSCTTDCREDFAVLIDISPDDDRDLKLQAGVQVKAYVEIPTPGYLPWAIARN